jgi:CBS-domain-containing membrane protein
MKSTVREKSTAEDVMTKRVVAVSQAAPYKEIVGLMNEYRVTAVPVVDDDGVLVGIVSEADLLLKEELGPAGGGGFKLTRRHRTDRAKAAGWTAAQLMTAPVLTIRPGAKLAEVAHIMHERGVKRLPVVDEGNRIVGIVSRADLLRVFLRPDAEIRREVMEDVLQRTLWIDPFTLRVTVEKGVVTLEGEVERWSLVPLIGELVEAIEGIVGVRNLLRSRTDDTRITVASAPWAVFAPGAVSPA